MSIPKNLRTLKTNFEKADGLGIRFIWFFIVKFVYSEKATKFCEISTLLLSTVHTDKSKVEISQNFVAFSEYMNFIITYGTITPSGGCITQFLFQIRPWRSWRWQVGIKGWHKWRGWTFPVLHWSHQIRHRIVLKN